MSNSVNNEHDLEREAARVLIGIFEELPGFRAYLHSKQKAAGTVQIVR